MTHEAARREVGSTRERVTLQRLFAEHGLGSCETFFEAGEGTLFPDGTEEGSGYVIDDRGRVFFWWTAWDAERRAVTFKTWEEVEPEPRWAASAEYREARAAAGLP